MTGRVFARFWGRQGGLAGAGKAWRLGRHHERDTPGLQAQEKFANSRAQDREQHVPRGGAKDVLLISKTVNLLTHYAHTCIQRRKLQIHGHRIASNMCHAEGPRTFTFVARRGRGEDGLSTGRGRRGLLN